MSFNKESVVYFGATPNEKQVVAKEIKDLGIDLLRKDTSSVSWEGKPTTLQANYGLYVHNISRFLVAANEGEMCVLKGDAFKGLYYDGDLFHLPYPTLVINWGFALAEEVAESLRSQGFRDMQVRGKPCMVHENPSVEVMKKARETKCLLTSPCVQDQMNITSFRSLMLMQKILSAFFKLHQYPAFVDSEHESSYRELFGDIVEEEAESEAMIVDSENLSSGTSRKRKAAAIERPFPISLPVPFEEAPVYVTDKYKPTSSGILIRYIPGLASFDARTPIAVIHRHFYHLLGDDQSDASLVFEKLKTAWGVLYKTEAGKILSHMFLCVDIALQLQTSIIPLIPKSAYAGMVMLGSGYDLRVENREVIKATSEELRQIIITADSHSQALWKIFKKIRFTDDETRVDRYRKCKRMFDLKSLLDVTPIGGTEAKEEVERLLPQLNFQEVPLAPIGPNIVHALTSMEGTSFDLGLLPYLHYSQVFSTDRRHIIWSAFGETAPSFRIPSGKTMSLTGKFETSYSAKDGKKVVRKVTKIGYQIVELSQALNHLDLTFKERTIMNPFGNSIVRVSDNSMFKTVEGGDVEKVIGAFRRVMGVNTVTFEASGSKRKAIDEGDEPLKKRRTVLEDDD